MRNGTLCDRHVSLQYPYSNRAQSSFVDAATSVRKFPKGTQLVGWESQSDVLSVIMSAECLLGLLKTQGSIHNIL